MLRHLDIKRPSVNAHLETQSQRSQRETGAQCVKLTKNRNERPLPQFQTVKDRSWGKNCRVAANCRSLMVSS